jgi:membrane protease subunit HflC
MGIKQTALVIFVGIFVLLVFNTFFSVHETRQAIVLQFGRPVGAPITEPGLKLKMPFIQQVQYLDKRILALDSPAEEVIASDQKRLVVDSFTRWRIIDPLQFYISVRDERIARSRLQAIVSSSLRSILGAEEFVTVVRDNRDDLMKQITERANEQALDLGINIVDVEECKLKDKEKQKSSEVKDKKYQEELKLRLKKRSLFYSLSGLVMLKLIEVLAMLAEIEFLQRHMV